MPRLHFVKRARRDHPQHNIKKGESYYWWKFRVGRGSRKCVSKERPRRSQLTQSEYYGRLYDIEDDFNPSIDSIGDIERLQSELEGMAAEVEALRDEQEERRSAMEDAFPNGCPVMEMLEARMDRMEELASQLEDAASSLSDIDTEAQEGETPEDQFDRVDSEVADILSGIDWNPGE